MPFGHNEKMKIPLPLGHVFKPFDPPQPELKRGENPLKVPLFNSDARGISPTETEPIKFENTPDARRPTPDALFST
jgi:hypothetical protein